MSSMKFRSTKMLKACPPAMPGRISAKWVLYSPSEVISLNIGTMFATAGYIIRMTKMPKRNFDPGIR